MHVHKSTKSPIWPIMKSNQTHIKKTHMEQPHHTTVLIGIKDINIKNIFGLKHQPHLEIQEKLDNDSPHCQGKCIKYNFQKSSKIPILDYQGFTTLLLLKKRRFQCKSCQKVTISETSLVKKNCQISQPI